jgi:4-hydroxybenzoate polyprenyltransferase
MVAGLESNIKTGLGFIFKPYFNRVKLGEGGLVVFNLAHSIYAHAEVKPIVIETLISFVTMCALYGFNDYVDRMNDINNEKKDKSFVSSILVNTRLFILVNAGLSILTLSAAYFFLDLTKVGVLVLLYAVNCFYSIKLKSVPVFDILIVMVWGGFFVLLVGKNFWMLALVAGVMTGMAHLFQMLTDKVSDEIANVKTSVVAMPGFEMMFLSMLSIGLGASLYFCLGWWWALTCIIPILVYCISRRVTLSWHVSRFFFFMCWIALLNSYYGSL